MNTQTVTVLARRNADSDDWQPVFRSIKGVSPEYAAQYVELNRELGWTKYRLIY